MEIMNVFEANGYERDMKRIKDQWRRMKCTAKKNVSSYERERNKTGGGSPPPMPTDSDYNIRNICPEDFIIDTSKYDTDGVTTGETSTSAAVGEVHAGDITEEFILDPETGLFLEPAPQNDPPSLPKSIPINQLKSKRKISGYEEELLIIERKRLKQDMEQKAEIHKEVMSQLALERKRKEVELEAAIFKRKKEELEFESLKKKINNN